MTERDYDDFDFDMGDDSEWYETEGTFKCLDCGHTGKALEKVVSELQGDGVMTGYVQMSTGDVKCKECDSDNLEEADEPGLPVPMPQG